MLDRLAVVRRRRVPFCLTALLAAGCDKGVTPSDQVEPPFAGPKPKPEPESRATGEPPPQPQTFLAEGGVRVPLDATLLRRTDETGEPIVGLDLRNPGVIARKLKLPLVRRSGVAFFGTGDDMALRLDAGDRFVALELRDPMLSTNEGIHVGMGYEAFAQRAEGTKCDLAGGEDGQLVRCTVRNGMQAEFESDAENFWDQPSPVPPELVPKLIGDAWPCLSATVRRLETLHPSLGRGSNQPAELVSRFRERAAS